MSRTPTTHRVFELPDRILQFMSLREVGVPVAAEGGLVAVDHHQTFLHGWEQADDVRGVARLETVEGDIEVINLYNEDILNQHQFTTLTRKRL